MCVCVWGGGGGGKWENGSRRRRRTNSSNSNSKHKQQEMTHHWKGSEEEHEDIHEHAILRGADGNELPLSLTRCVICQGARKGLAVCVEGRFCRVVEVCLDLQSAAAARGYQINCECVNV